MLLFLLFCSRELAEAQSTIHSLEEKLKQLELAREELQRKVR